MRDDPAGKRGPLHNKFSRGPFSQVIEFVSRIHDADKAFFAHYRILAMGYARVLHALQAVGLEARSCSRRARGICDQDTEALELLNAIADESAAIQGNPPTFSPGPSLGSLAAGECLLHRASVYGRGRSTPWNPRNTLRRCRSNAFAAAVSTRRRGQVLRLYWNNLRVKIIIN